MNVHSEILSTVFCILANFHHKVLQRERELIEKDRKTSYFILYGPCNRLE